MPGRKYIRQIEQVLASKFGTCERVPTKGHLKYKVPVRGKMRSITCASSPSDEHITLANVAKQADRMLKG